MSNLQLLTLKFFPNKMEAELAKGLLESAGIPSMISANDTSTMFSTPSVHAAGVELCIRQEDLEKARIVLSL